MLFLKLLFIAAFTGGYLPGRFILKKHGRITENPALNKKMNIYAGLAFAAAISLAAAVRLTVDTELHLPVFIRIHATHFKWWGVEFLFSGMLGFACGLYASEPPRFKKRLFITSAVLFAFILYGEYVYTRPIYEQCFDKIENGVIMQSHQSTCGPAALANLFAHFGKKVSERDAAMAARTRKTGTTGDELAMAAAKIDGAFFARYFKMPIEKVEKIGLPCILSFNEEHFIVLIGKRGHLYEYIDPSIGRCMMKKSDLLKEWDGKSLFIMDRDFIFDLAPGEYSDKLIQLKAAAKFMNDSTRPVEFSADGRYDDAFAAFIAEYKKNYLGEGGAELNPYVNLSIYAKARSQK